MSKVYLKNNWAETFVYGDKTPGVYVGREDELQSLRFTLVNNDSASILISSVRGVGKTSFVHKALSEAAKDVHPIFVNAGHVMSCCREEGLPKRELLNSLIRSAYFEFKEQDSEIEDLYYKAIGKFKEYKFIQESKEKISEKEVGLTREFNIRHFFAILGAVLATVGIMSEIWWIKIIGILGTISMPVSFIWKTKWTNKLRGIFGQETVIENSDDYIELLFERWLKKQKDKKLIFVIDELDKIADETQALKLIKEYKNLFSRSFAKFIFITGEDAYLLTEKDRGLKAEDGGIFPTLFTHIYYLPLPTTSDLEKYFDDIFSEKEDVSEEDLKQLKNYLLFRAKNDFFSLKNLINDLAHTEDNKIFFDIDSMKNYDHLFEEAAKLYFYSAKFCDKYHKRAKKYWKENSAFQKEVFDFLNQYFKKNFSIIIDSKPACIQSLLSYLQRFGIIEIVAIKDITDPNGTKKQTEFRWTGEYKPIETADQLFKEEEKFLGVFEKLIKVANDLDDLPAHYSDKKFEDYEEIVEGKDGNNLSSVNLYTIYSKFEDLYNDIKDPQKRMEILIEDVDNATEEIEPQASEVGKRSFQVFINTLQSILTKNSNLFAGQNFGQRPSAFSACPNFNSVFGRFEHRLYGKNDGSKEVLIVKNFDASSEIHEGLKSLNEQKNLLVINFIDNNSGNLPKNLTIRIEKTDKRGRKRTKGITIKNFINFVFDGNFRNLSDILRQVEKHLV